MDMPLPAGGFDAISVYMVDDAGPSPSPPTATPEPVTPPPSPSSDDFELLGCSEDNVPRGNRVRAEPRQRENVKSR